MSEQIYLREQRDGLRSTWACWPSTKELGSRRILPLSIVYTPHKDIEGLALVEYDPITCSKCKAVLNPHCHVDFSSKAWACPICLTRNIFPTLYRDQISESSLPTELISQYTTIEYILGSAHLAPPVYLFVIDTSCSQEELNSLKSSLQQAVNLLPAESLVGLISFGKNVFLYNLGWSECSRSLAFRGEKEYDLKNIHEALGVEKKGSQSLKKYLMPVAECEFAINSVIEEMSKDPWPVSAGNRPFRCTGTALFVGVTLLEISCPKIPAKLMLFASGAATYGPGLIVNPNLVESIRTQKDIKSSNAPLSAPASSFYTKLALRASQLNHSIDIFCCAIDQIGIHEMRSLVQKTGGNLVLTDTYKSEVFSLSLQKVFTRDATGALVNGQGTVLTVLPSIDVKLNGMVGLGAAAIVASDYSAAIEVGMGQTNSWRLGSMDSNASVTCFFEVENVEVPLKRPFAYVQFQSRYLHSGGSTRLRITTLKLPYSDDKDLGKLINDFDQETAAVVIAKWAVVKTETEECIDVIKWVDRMLIRLVKRFAAYEPNHIESFRICEAFSFFPQFMFHLRRSVFLQTFNVSPDESSYYRIMLLKENVTNALLMIQPALLKYSFENPQAEPVLLDIISLKNDVILLLDTFFNVLIWRGSSIAQWVKQGLHEQPDYEHFKQLLQIPRDDVKIIVNSRFPVPKVQETDSGKGPERLLKARVNPSGGGTGSTTVDGGNYFTEDASLKLFMEKLIEYTVKV